MNQKYDITIIGTGPGGLEAAITCKIRGKNILLIGKNLSPKVSKAHQFDNYLGLPEISGEELNKKFKEHLKQMGITITEATVNKIYNMGDFYNIQIDDEFIESKAVILATGIEFGKPYVGEEEFLGKGVSYCATCDGNFFKQKKIIVISSSSKEEKEANYLNTLTSEIKYIPLYKNIENLDKNIEVIKEIPKEIKGDLKVKALKTDKNEHEVDGIFILRDGISPKNLVPGLEMDGNFVKVNRKMETNLSGLFACGDIVGKPYQAIKAAGEGNVAALSAVDYVDK